MLNLARNNNLSLTTVLAAGVATIVVTPVVFTIYKALTVDSQLWLRLFDTRLKVLLPNTLKLLVSVGLLTTLIGVSMAWLVTRFDFPGKKIWEWALILPMAIPAYVMAYAYASIMAPGGIAEEFWSKTVTGTLGLNWSMPDLYSFWGVSLILSFAHYPYVYLLTRASLLSQNSVYDEVAKTLGASPWKKFWQVNFPLIYPGIAAGLALVFMEVMADFGTVSMLRYPTFTEAIYRQMTSRFDPAGAAALSSVLLTLMFTLFVLEKFLRGRKGYEQTKGKFKKVLPTSLSSVRAVLACALVCFLLFCAFIGPLLLLLDWSIEAINKGELNLRLWKLVANTLIVSSLGATATVALALPAAWLYVRRKSLFSKITYYATTLGYSLPGPVIAVGLLLGVTSFLPWLYGSIVLLIMAYVVRFIAMALQAQESAISLVSKSMEEAATTMGAGPVRTFREILFPLIKPSLLTGWVLVFTDSMKELPATMILRPLAYDTLAIRVWMETAESMWEMAALPAIFIVIAGFIPIAIIINKMTKTGGDSSVVT